MKYDPRAIQEAYNIAADEEDRAEKSPSLRTEIPREFIKRYIRPSDIVLDAGGGTGINAIMMAGLCQHVTLLDITPKILERAVANVRASDVAHKIILVQGDITDLVQFADDSFSFVVCVGDALSYVLEQGYRALTELVRVAQPGAILVLGCDSKYGFARLRLGRGLLDEAIEIVNSGQTICGMGPRTRVYTVEEMTATLEKAGCDILEAASTPTLTDTIDKSIYAEEGQWAKLRDLEMKLCTQPELLGMGLHLLFIAQKR